MTALIDAMCTAGLAPVDGAIDTDGRLHRFHVPDDKPGSKNGWYVAYLHPWPAGAFGSWRTGESHTWRAGGAQAMSPDERAEHRRQFEAMRRLRNEEDARTKEAARVKAARLWRLAKPASTDHAYLEAKHVRAFGIRQLRDMLLIPARAADGVLHTLQFIGPDGHKRFLTGGRIRGCYYAIGRPADTLLLAEGYATAATIFEATGHATACAFNAGNLAPVARALREKFPGQRIVVCADDDNDTPGNPGLTAAWEAATAVRGWVAVPSFGDKT